MKKSDEGHNTVHAAARRVKHRGVHPTAESSSAVLHMHILPSSSSFFHLWHAFIMPNVNSRHVFLAPLIILLYVLFVSSNRAFG